MEMKGEIKIKDNTKKILHELKEVIPLALSAIGARAETHAKDIITRAGAVDTGRLRNSITYAVQGENVEKSYQDNNGKSFDNSLISQPMENEVIFGTNVEYAAGIETGSHRKKGAVHFIQKAATNYRSEYRKIIEEILKGETGET